MKLKTKNISFIIATAIFVFSGIFGLAQAAESGEKIDIQIVNKIKYGVKLEMLDLTMTTAKKEPIKLSVHAGESKTVQENDLAEAVIFRAIEPLGEETIEFISESQTWLSKRPTMRRVDVIEGGEYKGTFTVLARLKDNTLYITIDSRDHALMANFPFPFGSDEL